MKSSTSPQPLDSARTPTPRRTSPMDLLTSSPPAPRSSTLPTRTSRRTGDSESLERRTVQFLDDEVARDAQRREREARQAKRSADHQKWHEEQRLRSERRHRLVVRNPVGRHRAHAGRRRPVLAAGCCSASCSPRSSRSVGSTPRPRIWTIGGRGRCETRPILRLGWGLARWAPSSTSCPPAPHAPSRHPGNPNSRFSFPE
jgi:hypothetical protein